MLFKTHRIAPKFSPDSGPRAIPGHHHDPGRSRFLGLNNLNDLDRLIHHKYSPLTTRSTSFTQNTATPMQHNSSRPEYETNTVIIATNHRYTNTYRGPVLVITRKHPGYSARA